MRRIRLYKSFRAFFFFFSFSRVVAAVGARPTALAPTRCGFDEESASFSLSKRFTTGSKHVDATSLMSRDIMEQRPPTIIPLTNFCCTAAGMATTHKMRFFYSWMAKGQLFKRPWIGHRPNLENHGQTPGKFCVIVISRRRRMTTGTFSGLFFTLLPLFLCGVAFSSIGVASTVGWRIASGLLSKKITSVGRHCFSQRRISAILPSITIAPHEYFFFIFCFSSWSKRSGIFGAQRTTSVANGRLTQPLDHIWPFTLTTTHTLERWALGNYWTSKISGLIFL